MTKKVKEKENALFLQRLVAYIIDAIIISIVASLISFPFYDNDSAQKLSASSSEIVSKYMNQEIDIQTYMSESMDISYEMARKNGVVSLITVFLGVLYFVCYQFYNKGQTI